MYKNDEYKYEKNKVYTLPRVLDEEVARLHLEALGAELSELTEDKAEYIGVKKEGPFKSDQYRYWLIYLKNSLNLWIIYMIIFCEILK